MRNAFCTDVAAELDDKKPMMASKETVQLIKAFWDYSRFKKKLCKNKLSK